jgi:hypothetical protein
MRRPPAPKHDTALCTDLVDGDPVLEHGEPGAVEVRHDLEYSVELLGHVSDLTPHRVEGGGLREGARRQLEFQSGHLEVGHRLVLHVVLVVQIAKVVLFALRESVHGLHLLDAGLELADPRFYVGEDAVQVARGALFFQRGGGTHTK